MKRSILTFIAATMVSSLIAQQVPQGFNYQAIARDGSGNPLVGQTMDMKITILSDTVTPTVVREELFTGVRTNSFGMFTIVLGSGTYQAGSATNFSDINWKRDTLFVNTKVNYKGNWLNMGTTRMWSVPYSLVAEELSGAVKKLQVTGETTNNEEALFEVKNKDGQTIFAVYNYGVRIYVDNGAKGAKGGFAVGGFGTSKALSQNLLVVNPDCVRVYIDTNIGKGTKGGFAVGGFGGAKVSPEEYIRVTRDSTRIYLNNSATKGKKGGFAVGGFGNAKSGQNNYMSITDDSTLFYVRNFDPLNTSTFNIISLDSNNLRNSLLSANSDTLGMAGVVNLKNNLLVSGNLNVKGTVLQDTTRITDFDGNRYDSIRIGTQVWLKQNLKVTHYNDGTVLSNLTDSVMWASEGQFMAAYCWYDNNVNFKDSYGALYNWSTIQSGLLCPKGWHVPTVTEWDLLLSTVGGAAIAADKLKEAGTIHWSTPTASTDQYGFSALPAGNRMFNGKFVNLKAGAMFWSSTLNTTSDAFAYSLGSISPGVIQLIAPNSVGGSVRCLKN